MPRRRVPDHADETTTDVDDYLATNPEFVACRRKHQWADDDECEIVDAPGDPSATHHRPKPCRRCGAVFRERFNIRIRGGRVVQFVQLDSRTDYPQGYLAKGVRINRRYVTEYVTVRQLERQLMRTRSRKRKAA